MSHQIETSFCTKMGDVFWMAWSRMAQKTHRAGATQCDGCKNRAGRAAKESCFSAEL